LTEYRPISPAAALELLEDIGVADKERALASFVEGDVVRAYAEMTETIDGRGGCIEVRGKRIDRKVWSRIIDQGKTDEIWATGSVRLDGDGITNGRQAIKLIGIGFDERAVRKAAIKHAAKPAPSDSARASSAGKASKKMDKAEAECAATIVVPPVQAPDAPPLIKNEPPATAPVGKGLAPDVLCVTIKDAAAILNVSRSTVYVLEKKGDLIFTKVGGRTMVDADSIRRHLGKL